MFSKKLFFIPFFTLLFLLTLSACSTSNESSMSNVTTGTITIELASKEAPISTENFKQYVADGFYNGTIFHRVIDGFMVQGGGFDMNNQQKTTRTPIKNEADNGLTNDRGTIAMARTSAIDSATAQFFINTVDNDFLNHSDESYGYAVFGKVTSGMDIVDQIEQVETGSTPAPDWPIKNVEITNAQCDGNICTLEIAFTE